ETPESVLIRSAWNESLMLSTPPNPGAWAWGYRSAALSLKVTADGCGPPRMTALAQLFILLFEMSIESSLLGSKAVVFVVDDDVSVREGLERLLLAVGWKVETFGSAQEFLAYRIPDIPSCLVLDVG